MKRAIRDTNIYGIIIENMESEKIEKSLHLRKDIFLYGNTIVRKELRSISKNLRMHDSKVRIMVLGLYDRLVKDTYPITDVIRMLADDYYKVFSVLARNSSKPKMLNDFLTVACATVHNFDLVVSDDDRTMVSKEAIAAYKTANRIKGYNTPNFIDYADFRRLLNG